jgi:hypothetical protein
MQGIPLKGYQPLPPNPPEDNYHGEVENQSDAGKDNYRGEVENQSDAGKDNYHGEVENQSDAGSVVIPPLDNKEGTLVMVENPTPLTTSMSVTPLEPLLLRLESLGNIIDEEISQLPERDFTETYMGSTEPIFGDEYMTPIHPTTTVDTNPTPAHSIWRNSSGHDLYEHFKSIRQPFPPHDTPSETGPFGQTMNHPIDQVINPIVTLAQVHPNAGLITSTHSQGTSIPTPTFTNFHSTTLHVLHDLAGTYLHQRMEILASQM